MTLCADAAKAFDAAFDLDGFLGLVERPGPDGYSWKAEFVVGRMAAAIGDEAFGFLGGFEVLCPTRAHMALALHLAHGGLQATLNFDDGIELAYLLITGRKQLDATIWPTQAGQIKAWRALCPEHTWPINVIVEEAGFMTGIPRQGVPTLLKLHGSVDGPALAGGRGTAVVTEDAELFELSARRLAALDELAARREIILTGYSGDDTDYYDPLLERLRQHGRWRWVVPSLDPRVKAELAGIPSSYGRQPEEGDAISALAPVVGPLPDWSDVGGDRRLFHRRFKAWAANIDPHGLAETAGRLLIDSHLYDDAIRLLELLRPENPKHTTLLRLADAHFHRGTPLHKREAARLYLRLALGRGASGFRSRGARRWGESHRSLALAGGWRAVWHLGCVGVGAAVAMGVARLDGDETGGVALSWSVLASTGLRLGETLAPSAVVEYPKRVLLRALIRSSMYFARRARYHAADYRRLVPRLIEVELVTLLAVVDQVSPPATMGRMIDAVQRDCRRIVDKRGLANCALARSAMALASGDILEARRALALARDSYRLPENGFDPSGISRTALREALIDAVEDGR